MHLIIHTPYLSLDDLVFSEVATTDDNPYFTNGSVIAIDTNVKPDFWSTIENGDFVVIESNGLTSEKELTVRVTKKNNTLLLTSTSSYFEFEKVININNMDSIKVLGKVVFTFKSFDKDVVMKRFNQHI